MPDTTLEYFGKKMSPVTVDLLTPTEVAEVLAIVRRYANVVLEPGDGTRYELHLIYRPHDPDCLLVVRDFDLAPLSNGNEWTRRVLRWWLGLLFDALKVQHEVSTAEQSSEAGLPGG